MLTKLENLLHKIDSEMNRYDVVSTENITKILEKSTLDLCYPKHVEKDMYTFEVLLLKPTSETNMQNNQCWIKILYGSVDEIIYDYNGSKIICTESYNKGDIIYISENHQLKNNYNTVCTIMKITLKN